MAKSPAKSGSDSPFDLDKLRELLEMMEKHGLTEISLQRGEEKWRLRRGPLELTQMVAAPVAAAPAQAAPAAAPAPAASTAAPAEADPGLLEIKSPTVGTFYSAASPDDPPFVTVGAKVQADTMVSIVEAMKVFNQIPAEVQRDDCRGSGFQRRRRRV